MTGRDTLINPAFYCCYCNNIVHYMFVPPEWIISTTYTLSGLVQAPTVNSFFGGFLTSSNGKKMKRKHREKIAVTSMSNQQVVI